MARMNASLNENLLWKFLLPVFGIIFGIIVGLTLIKTQISNHNNDSDGTLQIGSTLPDFILKSIDNKKNNFSDIQARVVMVNFWATWCEACMIELPGILELRKSFHDKGFELVAINLDEDPHRIIPKVLKRLGIDFPVYLDLDGAVSDLFQVHAIPLTVILDHNRTVLLIESGERNWNGEEIQQKMNAWLSK